MSSLTSRSTPHPTAVNSEADKLDQLIQKGTKDVHGEKQPVQKPDARAIAQSMDHTAASVEALCDRTIAIKPQIQQIGAQGQAHDRLVNANKHTKAFGKALIAKLPQGSKMAVQKSQDRIEAAQAKAIAAYA